MLAGKLFHRGQSHLRECPEERFGGAVVTGDLQSERLRRCEKSRHRPVATIGLQPHRAAEHELDQRSYGWPALLSSTKLLTSYPREIDDWSPISRKRRLRKRPIHEATDPDRRARACAWRVSSEDQELLKPPLKQIDKRQPFRFRIRPQDRDWPFLPVPPGVPRAQLLDQTIQYGCLRGDGRSAR
jgi:hypothetical protein